MRIVKVAVLLTTVCFAAGSALAVSVQELPGYSRLTVSTAFEDYLSKHKDAATQLQQKPDLSRLIMSRALLQQQLISGNATLSDIEKQYLGKADTKAPDEKPVAGSSAQSLLQRAIGALSSDKARARAATQIDTDLTNAANNNGNAAAAEITEITALLAYIQENPGQLEDILSNPDILARLEQAGIDVADLRGDSTPTTGGEIPPPHSGSSGGITPPGGIDDPVGNETTIAAPLNVNINAIPQNTGLDANGWPKHLNVPPTCPPPTADIRYEFDHVAISKRGMNSPSELLVRPFYLRGSQNSIRWDRDGKNQFALPFYSHNEQEGLYIGGTGAYGIGNRYAIAHCPGDFNNATPAGKAPLSEVCSALNGGEAHAIISVAAGTEPTPNRCVLQPNQQYFINIQPYDIEAVTSGICLTHECGGGFTGHSFDYDKRKPPYAGPCLTEGPYPSNYDALSCGENHAKPINHCNGAVSRKWTCYDPHNETQPQAFALACNNQNGRWTWVEGYMKPASSRYVCDYGGVTEFDGVSYVYDETSYEFDTRGAENIHSPGSRPPVCAAHREGQYYEYKCGRRSAATDSYIYGYNSIYQCQFNTERRRYAWTTVSQSALNPHRTETSCYAASIARGPQQGCVVGATVYAVGSKLTYTCSNNQRTVYACKEAGEAVNSTAAPLPSLQLIEGAPLHTNLSSCSVTVQNP